MKQLFIFFIIIPAHNVVYTESVLEVVFIAYKQTRYLYYLLNGKSYTLQGQTSDLLKLKGEIDFLEHSIAKTPVN